MEAEHGLTEPEIDGAKLNDQHVPKQGRREAVEHSRE